MGVSRFFKSITERYPLIITPFKSSPPPIDNLYLDMNGIIHNCTHPNDIDATRRSATEKEMVEAMFGYLEKLFNAVQPRKYFFMAIDGCAPRAKMNQQRQRRYRAGYEMMKAREEALKVGEDVPDEGDVFDSNCITPGTEFMARVQEQFEYFISMKIQSDSAWRNCTIIFSGQNEPGEGEHKIVDFIRRRKSQPDYDPNETHCMYGLDADLIMLALATHEPHFVLLREVVSFNRMSRREEERHAQDAEKGVIEDPTLSKPDSFVLLHISLFREYLDLDIRRDEELPNYDMERMIDDFVMMCFLIGNDFLPSLPTLGINDGGLSILFNIYRSHIASRGYNLVSNGKINWPALEIMFSHLGQLELETLRARREEALEHLKRMARRDGGDGTVAVPPTPITNMADFKKHYYCDKLGFSSYDPSGQEMLELRKHYVEGLQWVLDYYFQGPSSWKWYYPHHYAPLASDLVLLGSIGDKIKFDQGEPFLPHQQLLAVLPPMSHRAMPKAYWNLFTSPNSPLKQYFPDELKIDREGARAPWEGHVLIPFMEERILIAAYQSVQHITTEQDRLRNRNLKPVLFKHDPSVVPYDVPSTMFETLRKITVRRNTIEYPKIPTPNGKFIPQLCRGVKLYNELIEGFSSLSSFTLAGFDAAPSLESNVINIFGQTSKKESVIVNVEEGAATAIGDASQLAHIVGKQVWVGMPHLKRARVSSIVDRRQRILGKFNDDGTCTGVVSEELSNEDFRNFRRECTVHQEMLKTKCGIFLPEINVLVFVHRFTGMRLSRRGRFVHIFSHKETCYPLQLVGDASTMTVSEDAKNVERDQTSVDSETGATCLYIGPDPPGHRGPTLTGSVGWARLAADRRTYDMAIQYRPFIPNIPEHVLNSVRSDNWHSLGAVCSRVSSRLRFSVSPGTITQLASSIITSSAYGGVELGMCIKFTGKNLARIGYARLQQTQYNAWYVGGGTALFEHMEDETEEGYHLGDVHGGGKQAHRGGGGGGGHHGHDRHSHHGHGAAAKSGAGGGHSRDSPQAHNASGRGVWQFSTKALNLILEYCDRFTPIVERLEAARGNNVMNFDVSSVLRGAWESRDAGEVIREISSWIEQTGMMKKPMMSAAEEAIAADQFSALEEAVTSSSVPTGQTLHMSHVQHRYCHFPTSTVAEGFSVSVPLPKEQKITLLARVVYCRSTGSVPFGFSGTVSRLVGDNTTAEVVFDETFVGGSTLGGRLKTARGALVPLISLLVVSSPDTSVASSKASHHAAASSSHASAAAASASATGKTQGEIDAASGGIDVGRVLDKLSSGSLSVPAPKSKADEVIMKAAPRSIIQDNASAAASAAAVNNDNLPTLGDVAPPQPGVVNSLRVPKPSSRQSRVEVGRKVFIKFAAPTKEKSIDKIIGGRLSETLKEIFAEVEKTSSSDSHHHGQQHQHPAPGGKKIRLRPSRHVDAAAATN